jgi:hypothetical protein
MGRGFFFCSLGSGNVRKGMGRVGSIRVGSWVSGLGFYKY